MDIRRAIDENKGLVKELAIAYLAGCLYDNLAHVSVADSERWEVDSKTARENFIHEDWQLELWTRDFVNTLAYAGHYGLIDELPKRGLTLEESGGISSCAYVEGLPHESFSCALRETTYDQKLALFGVAVGSCVWNGFASPLIHTGSLRPPGYYPRPKNTAA